MKSPATRSQLVAIILAAGLSSRAAPANKLLLPVGSAKRPVLCATIDAFLGLNLGEVLVATGHDSKRIESVLSGVPVRTVPVSDYFEGMGNSIAACIRAAPKDCLGFMVCPGDLPGLSRDVVSRIADRFLLEGGAKHIVPTAWGQRGHPVVIGSALRSELENLCGDTGARRVLERVAENCCFVEMADAAIAKDIDDPSAVRAPYFETLGKGKAESPRIGG